MVQSLNRLLDFLVNFSGMFAGGLIGLMSLGVTYDVLARVLFNSPTSWALEFSTYAMVAMAFLGSPWALEHGMHVSVEVLLDRLSPKTRVPFTRFALLMVTAVSVIVLWQSIIMVSRSYRLGLASPTLYIPIWLIQLTIPYGAILLLGVAIRHFISPPVHGSEHVNTDVVRGETV